MRQPRRALAAALAASVVAWIVLWFVGQFSPPAYERGVNIAWVVVALLGGLAAFLAAFDPRQRATRRSFVLLGVGAVAWAAAQAAWTYSLLRGLALPFRAPAELGYLLALPLGLAVAAWPRRRTARRGKGWDAAIGVAVAALVSFEFVIEPILVTWHGEVSSWLGLAYLLSELSVASAIVIGLLLEGWRQRGRVAIVAAGVLALCFTDTGVAIDGSTTSSWSTLMAPGMMLPFAAIGAAALLPARWAHRRFRRVPQLVYSGLLASLLLAVAVADAVESDAEEAVGAPLSYVVAAMLVAMTARVLVLARDRARTATELTLAQRQLRAVKSARDKFLVELVNAREHEARRIAYLLHDDAVQQLTALQLRLELAGAKNKVPELSTLSEQTSAVIAAIRRLLVDLHPQILESQGLGPATDVVAESLRERGIEVRVQPFPHRLPVELEALAYRLVQESLTNVLQHSDATRAEVELGFSDGVLRARINDNGNGFVPDAISTAEQKGAIGLYVARERAELVGGRFFVRSSAGYGTDVIFELPVPQTDIIEAAAS